MWALRNELNGKLFYFLADKEYNVGRKDCDIVIANDISISRKHAVIKVIHSEKNVCDKSKLSQLSLRDDSKLGSRVSSDKVNNAEKLLKEGDVLVFGTGTSNKFKVVREPLLVTTSCLSSQQKREIRRLVFRLGGNMLNDWSEGCSHVIMSNLSITIKVACALISQSFVVNVDYLKDLVAGIEIGDCNKFPEVEDYLPIMAESQVNPSDVSFSPKSERSVLFSGKVFIFLEKNQYERLLKVIELGGGMCKLVDATADSVQIENLLKPFVSNKNNCVMLPDEGIPSSFYSISIILKKSKLRMISESELGFAVLHCNTDIYCNAASNYVRNSQSQNFTQALEVSQANTEDNTQRAVDSDYTCDVANSPTDNNPKNVSDSTPEVLSPPQAKPNVFIKVEPLCHDTMHIDNAGCHDSDANTENFESKLNIQNPCNMHALPGEFSKKPRVEKMPKDVCSMRSAQNKDTLAVPPLGFLTTSCMNTRFRDIDFCGETDVEGSTVIEERNLMRKKPFSPTSDALSFQETLLTVESVKNYKTFHKSRIHGKKIHIPAKRICRRDFIVHVNADIGEGFEFDSLKDSLDN